ncbi:flagellar biosynthesis protein FlhA [Falsiroseomonas selenitidurans]|uniref:Flagellar biosynthesis protein FlhA n=1 Tax=Falsiroseomonas selenitidurans TaxID=2716335 RepID=A0ABX1EAG5_9PROT|nr:flagellar biosynthesis protein FlhA [Falsiroseomonas selenitidurans]NKC34001.1 flagellar biosynthesis protein FlhA [Falsiroseomonas selenitidurans]
MAATRSMPGWVRTARPGGDLTLAFGVMALLAIMVVPLPTVLLDFGLAVSITSSVLVLMVALFLQKPLEFTSFPTVLLLTTLLRLGLNVATTRAILSHGHEGEAGAGQVVAAFGGFLMGGDVLVGLVVFSILLIVNFMVVTKGSGRIAEVAARFSLDAMPGKQMAIDADLSSGVIDEAESRRRRRELEQESAFFGAMDGAAKFVRGDAIAGIIVTAVNLLGGFAIGLGRHGMPLAEAVQTFSLLTVGDGLVSQIPSLLVSVAAGIVVTKAGAEGRADQLLALQLAGGPKPLAIAAGGAVLMAFMPGMPAVPFLALAGIAAAAAWLRRNVKTDAAAAEAAAAAPPRATAPPGEEAQTAESLRVDLLRIELGYGLLSLAAGEAPQLTEQIRALRRTLAAEMGFVLPSVRVQDNLTLAPDQYMVRVKEVEAGQGRLRPPLHLAIDPTGGTPALPGERCNEPAFGLPAVWIEEAYREEALARGCTVVDTAGVLATHLTEIVRENMAEMLSHADTRRLLDNLPEEQRRLVAELVPAQVGIGTIQRVLQALLAERVSIRDLPTILEGVQEASLAGARTVPALVSNVRLRLARQLTDAARNGAGQVPLISLSGEWEAAFGESLVGPAEDRQLAMAPSRLTEFVRRLRDALDAAAAQGEAPVLVCSGAIRAHVRAVVERFRPMTTVLAQGEIHARARIRSLGQV